MAANFRMIYDNAARRATVTASSQASASLSPSNLFTSIKSQVWRATGETERLTSTWPTLETIGGAALAFTNLSPTATFRLRLTAEVQATNLALQSQALDNAAWSNRWGGSATITANDATYLAPDGAQTVDKFVTTTIAGAGQSFALTGGVTYTFSCWLLSPVSQVKLGYGTSGTVAPTTSTAFAAGTQLVRRSITFTPGSTATYFVGVIGTAASQTYYAWGAQLEVGAAASSYYPTTTAALARPLGYIDAWQTYTLDSTAVLACPAPAFALLGWSGVNSFGYGGGVTARVWVTPTQAYGMALDIVDTNNTQGYIEAGRFFTGSYWEGVRNVDYGAAMSIIDTTKNSRSDAGDLISDPGTKHRKLTFSLSNLSQAERATLFNVCKGNGMSVPVFVSIYPGNTDTALEQDHQGAFKLMNMGAMAMPSFLQYANSLELEEV